MHFAVGSDSSFDFAMLVVAAAAAVGQAESVPVEFECSCREWLM